MNRRTSLLGAVVVLGITILGRPALAQAPCLTTQAVVDSAREDALAILTAERPLTIELRAEHGIKSAAEISFTDVVRDRRICAKLAGAFDHLIAPGVSFAVVRLGPFYYARDPNQTRSTGVITDTTFRVLLRLGAEIPETRKP